MKAFPAQSIMLTIPGQTLLHPPGEQYILLACQIILEPVGQVYLSPILFWKCAFIFTGEKRREKKFISRLFAVTVSYNKAKACRCINNCNKWPNYFFYTIYNIFIKSMQLYYLHFVLLSFKTFIVLFFFILQTSYLTDIKNYTEGFSIRGGGGEGQLFSNARFMRGVWG